MTTFEATSLDESSSELSTVTKKKRPKVLPGFKGKKQRKGNYNLNFKTVCLKEKMNILVSFVFL